MQIGVVFPQTELGGDVGAVRSYALRVEELGFAHVLAYDHVLGADPEFHQGWDGPYNVNTTFHEPLVMFGYLAAITSRELVTGIIILPQRQTPAGRRPGLEQCRVRGARPGLHRPRPAAVGAGRAHAPAVDRTRRHLRGRLRHGDGRRAGAAAGAAADTGLVRRSVTAGLPADRPPRRRLVPAGTARP